MSNQIILVENLGKRYMIDHQKNTRGGRTFREMLQGKASSLFRWGARDSLHQDSGRASREEFWALRDINFEVRQGEVLGIIGRNGAGKSTLLKVLSRITEPTNGRVRIGGRVASLLEVGTGFHSELTGRENIFLNGSILGMAKAEIQRKFDEIVDFSGVEKFLDTPVKRYSSGMYVRLAFAVAAHLEPEILIVDEVLAVGDAEFQKKCLGKMESVAAKDGRTVLFVSHNMTAVRKLCSSTLLLNDGKFVARGTPEEIAEKYLDICRASLLCSPSDSSKPRIADVQILDKAGMQVSSVEAGDEARVCFIIDTKGKDKLVFGFTIFNTDDIGLLSAVTTDFSTYIPAHTKSFTIELPTSHFHAGRYRIEGALTSDGIGLEQNECYLQFEIHRGGPFELRGEKSRGAMHFPGKIEFQTS
ncbi:MAG: ABC transporter ATP-binding protein [Terracidiphilus sp.]|nr:ABC transporter ATP-binding protein [Terracidiphilus sp.]